MECQANHCVYGSMSGNSMRLLSKNMIWMMLLSVQLQQKLLICSEVLFCSLVLAKQSGEHLKMRIVGYFSAKSVNKDQMSGFWIPSIERFGVLKVFSCLST